MSIIIKKFVLIALLVASFLQPVFTYSAEPTFHAIYNCVFDSEVDNLFINQAVMSKDGNVVVCYGVNSSNKPVLYKMNSDGSNFVQLTLPEYVMDAFGGIKDITINGDGSIAYFYSLFRIYKVVNSSVIQIFDSETDSDVIGQFNSIQTTYSGDLLFFKTVEDYRAGSVWRIDQSGGNLTTVIDPRSVVHNLGTGAGLASYAISDNAGTIAFILHGYWDNDDLFHYDHELFVKNSSSGTKQLTFNETDLNDFWVDISGDGSRIVFHMQSPLDSLKHYYAINSDGSNETALAQIDIPGQKDMDYNGSTLLLNDSRSNGRLVATDSSSEFDIMLLGLGLWNTNITLSYTNKICFISNNGGTKGVYVGNLYTQDTGLNNPVIDSIYFDPLVFPKNNPETEIKLKTEIHNSAGIDGINYTGVRCLYNGIRAGNNDCQVWFEKDPNDVGAYGDEVTGDGVFTTTGNATESLNDSVRLKDQVYVRVVTRNTNKCYAVQDVILYIRNTVGIDKEETLPTEYSLSQNYPNPFNPSTKIKYSIPAVETGHAPSVRLVVYDILGREVETLVNEEQKPGNYEVEFTSRDQHLVSGIYFYRLQAGKYVATRKMLLIK